MERLTRLKVYWSIFHLKQHIRRKFSIEWLKIFVGRTGAVVTRLRVVDKRTPHHDAVMRCERGGQHICAVSVSAIVRSWTRLPFAVCFDEKTTEVRNRVVNLVGLSLPPLNHCRIERISSRQLAQLDR